MKRRMFVTVSTPSVAGPSGCLGDTEYRVADTTAETLLEGLSLPVGPAVADATIEHPAALTPLLGNTADDPIRIRNHGVWLFGVLALAPSPTPGEDTWKMTLFSPSYEASTRAEVDRGGSSLSFDGTPVARPLDTGEDVSRRYELYGDDLSDPGAQYAVGRFERKVSRYATGDDWNAPDYRLCLSIDEKRRFPF